MNFLNEQKWKSFFLVATSIFMSTLDSSIVNVALPFLMKDLQTNVQTIQWVMLIYLVTVSALLLTFGRLSDIKGRKPLYIVGFGIFTIGSLTCGLAQNAFWLIASRCVQGLGAAMLMACSPAIIVDAFPEKERGKVLGMIGAVVAAGMTAGPAIGGLILEYLSWRYIFLINIPIGIAAIAGAIKIMEGRAFSEKETEPLEPIDKTGSLLMIMILSGFIIFMSFLPNWGILSVQSLCFAGAIILLCLIFALNEYRTPYPLFDMTLLKIRLFLYPVLGGALLFTSLFCIMFIMPFYLVYPCGFKASTTGFIMIIPFFFLMVISPISGILYTKSGSRILCTAGMIAIIVSLFSFLTIEPSAEIFPIFWRISLVGIGTALYISPNNTVIMNNVPIRRRGIASGSIATARNLGMVIGVALAGQVFSAYFSELTNGASLEEYIPVMKPFFMISFRRVLIAGIVFSIIGLWITLMRGKESV
jgi:EmrB/QacA subfamily drug resistance transporter